MLNTIMMLFWLAFLARQPNVLQSLGLSDSSVLDHWAAAHLDVCVCSEREKNIAYIIKFVI